MFLVKPSYQILAISGKYDPEPPYNYVVRPELLIEFAGRTCYKSEDKITEDSAKKFIEMIRNRGHYSVTEHSWELRYYETTRPPAYKFLNFLQYYFIGTLVAGNARAFEEWDYDLKDKFETPDDDVIDQIFQYKRWDMLSATVKFICDRGVTHELVRHRPPAFSQESTRYCNYSKDKFGNNVTFVIPPWLEHYNEGLYTAQDFDHQFNPIKGDETRWLRSLLHAENDYFILLDSGWKPEQARSVLPNALKTEIVVTADLKEWQHIFKLRTSPAAHPQMRELMVPLQEDFKKMYPEVFA